MYPVTLTGQGNSFKKTDPHQFKIEFRFIYYYCLAAYFIIRTVKLVFV